MAAGLNYPEISAKIRAAGILDSQPPEAYEMLGMTVEAFESAIDDVPAKRVYAFERAKAAITGQKNFYRWGMGASGSPTNPLMAVQRTKFVPRSRPKRKR